jgi:hypothetical protein
MQGTIVDIGIEVTETFACDSLEACFNVGTSSDADAYCKLNITDGTAITDTFNIQDDTNAIIAEAIPADTQIECLPVAGTKILQIITQRLIRTVLSKKRTYPESL